MGSGPFKTDVQELGYGLDARENLVRLSEQAGYFPFSVKSQTPIQCGLDVRENLVRLPEQA